MGCKHIQIAPAAVLAGLDQKPRNDPAYNCETGEMVQGSSWLNQSESSSVEAVGLEMSVPTGLFPSCTGVRPWRASHA